MYVVHHNALLDSLSRTLHSCVCRTLVHYIVCLVHYILVHYIHVSYTTFLRETLPCCRERSHRCHRSRSTLVTFPERQTLLDHHWSESDLVMFDQRNRGKIKNSKILSWRLELSQLSYDIRHKPGAENVVPDAFSRVCASTSNATLRDLHESLGHPGFARLYHFVRQRNLPFSSEETKDVCRYCKTAPGSCNNQSIELQATTMHVRTATITVFDNCDYFFAIQIVSVVTFLTGAYAKLKRAHMKRYTLRSCAKRLGGLAVTFLPGASRSFNPALPGGQIRISPILLFQNRIWSNSKKKTILSPPWSGQQYCSRWTVTFFSRASVTSDRACRAVDSWVIEQWLNE